MDAAQQRYAIREAGDIGAVRRAALLLCKDQGWNETDQGRAALVATELGTNIVKHAQRGEIILGRRGERADARLELLALDRGPGMPSVDLCMQDGYSTAGSPGTGLGAVLRVSSLLDVYAPARLGTALLSRIWPAGRTAAPARMRSGAVCLAVAGESVCGDQWAESITSDHVRVLVADGLGHGRPAFDAATAAVRVFGEHASDPAAALLPRLHDALRSTRGAAAAIADIAPAESQLSYAGVGNISGSIVTADGSRSLVSQNGTLGMALPTVRSYTYPWSARATLIMHSDGLQTRWSLQTYPGLLLRDPSLIAAILYRDFARGRDDVSVVVLREAEASA